MPDTTGTSGVEYFEDAATTAETTSSDSAFSTKAVTAGTGNGLAKDGPIVQETRGTATE